MSTAMRDEGGELSPTKRALLEIRELRARLTAYEKAASEPIAIVGIGCRLPGGVVDEESLWAALRNGLDAIGEVPTDRWNVGELFDPDPDRAGRMSTRYGGFLESIDEFDAGFFGIAPREAASMDPQQRLFLEVAWEALEDAGVAPDRLGGSATGVFVGAGNSDYGRLLFHERNEIDAYSGSGGSLSVIAGRLSYTLGLQGPSLCVDTACSSSLVAVHLAIQSLRRRECDLAVVGGVNVILSPEAHITFTKARMLAPDGRCKTFDAAADGYGRGEGCVVVVLRRLGDARARGERVLAVMRGSAVNQDGRSAGLTAPNGPSQEAVIRSALIAAGLQPSDIDYVEAHGTGTPLGDPIELHALGAAYGAGRDPDRPLWVGSCKANFGHLEAAAGLTGLIKTVAALRRRELPRQLHLRRPNPLVDWAGLPLRVATAPQGWPAAVGQPARAGVSSFGFSGTNAHVIVEEADPSADAQGIKKAIAHQKERPFHVLALSARDPAALRELARRYCARMFAPVEGAPGAADICWSANTGRAHLAHRLAVSGEDSAAIRAALNGFVGGRKPAVSVEGTSANRPRVAFLFTGQGSQYADMGRGLYDSVPAFRAAVDRCASILDPLLDRPLMSLLADGTGALDRTANAQPALFTIEYAMAQMWSAWGIRPALVLGHSLGEYVAACVAGVIPLDDALRVIAERGRICENLRGDGAMAAVFAPAERIEAAIGCSAGRGGPLAIAAYNGPEHVIVSGARAAVEALSASFSSRGIRVTPLRISHGFHSPLVEPAVAPMRQALERVRFDQAKVPVVSNVSGRIAGAEELSNPDYWLRHLTSPVRFAESLNSALGHDITHFIEMGPHPVLLGMAAEVVGPRSIGLLPTLRRGLPDWKELIESVRRLYADGSAIDWEEFDRGHARRRVAVPTYPFQRRRHWFGSRIASATASGAISGADAASHAKSMVRSTLSRQVLRGPHSVNLSNYGQRWEVLGRLTDSHARTILRDCGIFAAAGDRANLQSVQQRLGAPSTYRHLLKRWLQRIVDSGDLKVVDGDYVAERALPDPELAARWDEAATAMADNPAVLRYIGHCGNLLPAVISGRENALETLFPGGALDLAEGIYERSAPMQYINGLAASAIEAFVAARGARAPLRVLEIGAGTGGSSSAFIPMFPADRTTYWYTDVTPLFFDHARVKFADHPFVQFAQCDLEEDLPGQGFPHGSFDVVLAANVVHATRDLRASLRSIRQVLAPGGLLLMIESTRHLAWFDMTTGLIEGWQLFADDLRTDDPLLAPSAWLEALGAAGFDDAGAWPRPEDATGEIGQHVLIGWAGDTASERAAPGSRHDAEAQAMQLPGAVAAAPPSGSAGSDDHPIRRIVAEAPAAERPELLRAFVRDHVVQVLRLQSDEAPGRNDRLMDLGLDSLMAVQLRNRLGSGLGLVRPLPASLMFDHPTIDAIADHLLVELDAPADVVDEGGPPANASASAVLAAVARKDEGLGAAAIAAMSEAEVEAVLLNRLGNL